MTEPSVPLAGPPTRARDGRTLIGHVVVCRDGHDIAVWQTNTVGENTGAWVTSDALEDPEVARRLLTVCARRALTAWAPDASVLRALEQVAGAPARDWAATAVAIPDVLAEVAEVRAAYDKRIAEERQVNKNLTPAEWAVDIPDPVPATADELREYARLVRQPGAPATAEALLTTSLLRWSLARWNDNMTVLGRREYLKRDFGPARPIPPKLETRLADAYADY